MQPQNSTNYRRTQIETATPLQLVALLYDGAIDNAHRAAKAIVDKDVATKTQAVDKLLAIVGELQSNLDMERGGDIARNLNALYTYMSEQTVQASVKLNPEPLESVVALLETVGSAWREIASRPEAASPAPAPQGPEPKRAQLSVRV